MLVFDTSPDDPSFIVIGSNISKVAEFGSTLDNTYISLYANDPLSNVGYIIGTSNQNLANPVFSIGMINTNTNAIYPDFTISNHFIGINNTTPQYTLDTSGNINLSGNIYNNALQTGYWYNPNNYLYVQNSNVGIGTSSSQYKFHVVGSTYITGSIYASNLKPSAFSDTTIANNILSGTLPLTVLPTTNVTSPASTYGSGAQVAQITTDIYGRVVQAQNVPIYISQSQILGLTSTGLTPAAIYGNYSNLINIPFYYDANNTTYYLGSGNIGIGTTNANLGKLQVQGDGYFNGTLFASNLNIIGELTTINVATSNSTQLDVINSGPGPALKVVQKDGSTVSQFYNNAGPVFTIAGSGSIGIGSSIPTVPLDIVGNVKISGGTISGGGLVQSAFTDTTNATNITSGTLSYSRLPNTTVTSGNYGTANSNVILNIDSTGRILFAVNCNIQIAPGQVTGLSTVATSGNYNDLINKTFILNGTAAYYSGGNIGISTNTPDSLLTIGGGVTDTTSTLKINVSDSSVVGAITDRIYLTSLGASNTRISHSATSNLYIYIGQSNNTGNFHIMSGAVGLNQYQDRITINNNGYVGINNSTPNYTLDLVGNFNLSGSFYNGGNSIATAGKIVASALPTTTVVAGSYGLAASNTSIVVDSTGRITNATNIGIILPVGQVTGLAPSATIDTTNATNITSGTLSSGRLPTTTVVAGGYGAAASNISIAVDATGRIVSASNIGIVIPVGQVTGLAPSATIDTTNAANISSGTLSASRLPGTTVTAGNYGLAASNITISVDTTGRITSATNIGIILPVGQITGLAPSATIDTTNATNITSGTLSAGRLPTTTVVAGGYGAAASNITINVDSTGRITSATNVGIILPVGQVTGLAPSATIDTTNATNITSGTLSASRLPTTTVVAGGYGAAASNITINVDSTGRITSATNIGIVIPVGQVTGLAPSATIDTTNAANIGSGTLPLGRLPTTNISTYGGPYGSATQSSIVTTDAYGRVTAVSSTNISITSNAVSGLSTVAGTGVYNDLINAAFIYSPTGTTYYNGTGNVGIGTKTALSALHVMGDILASGKLVASNLIILGELTTVNTTTSNSTQLDVINNGTGPALKVAQNTPDTVAEFYNNGSIAMQISASGNIGIGTKNATSTLYVQGTTTITGNISAGNLVTSAFTDTTNATNIGSGTLSSARLPSTTVTAGRYGAAGSNVAIYVDSTGRILSASNIGIVLPVGQVTGLAPSATIDTTNAANITSGTLSADRLATTTVVAGGYGAVASNISIAVDATGRILSASNVGIILPVGQVTGLAPSATIDTTNAANIASGTLLSARFPTTTVTAGRYGVGGGGGGGGATSSNVAIYVDSTGRILSASNVAIVLPVGQITGLAPSATIDTTNALNITSGTLSSYLLPTTGVTAGVYGDASHIPQINIDATGRIISSSTNQVSITTGQVSGLSYTALSANNLVSPPSAGTYGTAASGYVPIITIDVYGRVTSASSSLLTVPTSQLYGYITLSQISGLAASASTDTTNATNITSGTLSTGRLPTTTVTAGGYGGTSSNVAIYIDATGRILSASNIGIVLPVGQVTGLASSATIDTTNATNILTGTLSCNLLPKTNINTYGQFGSANQVPIITTDSFGRVVNLQNQTINLTVANLPSSAVNAGTYGSSTSIPTFTVDGYGRITLASNNAIVLSGVAATGQYSNLINIPFVYNNTGIGSAASNIYTPSYVYNVGIGMSNATAYPLDVNGIVRATQFIGDGSLLTGVVTSGGGGGGGGGGNSQWISSNQYIYVTSNVGIGTTIVSANNALQVQGNASITSLTTSNIITSNITILSSTAFLTGDTQVYRSALQTNPIRQFFTVGVSGQSNFTLSSPTVGRYTAYGSNVEIYQNGIKLGYQDVNNNDYSVSTITNSTSTGFSVTLVNGANQGDYIDITIWPQLISTNLILQPGYVYQQFYDLWSASNNNVYYNKGYVGIGTVLPSYPLHVAGNIYTANSIISFSDIINKTNIETIPNALDTVKKLRGVTYNRIDSGEQQIGLIAQEVLKIVPEVVSKTKDGLAVAYGNIVGLLIESIKELSEEVKVLRNIINSNIVVI